MPRTLISTKPYVMKFEMPKKLLSPEDNAKAPHMTAWSWSLCLGTLDYYDDEGHQHEIYAKISLADTTDLDADWDGEHTDYTITGAVADEDSDGCNCGCEEVS